MNVVRATQKGEHDASSERLLQRGLAHPFRLRCSNRAAAPSLSLRSLQGQGGVLDLAASSPHGDQNPDRTDPNFSAAKSGERPSSVPIIPARFSGGLSRNSARLLAYSFALCRSILKIM